MMLDMDRNDANREEAQAMIDDARMDREEMDREMRARRVRFDSTGMHQGLDLRQEALYDDLDEDDAERSKAARGALFAVLAAEPWL